VIVTTPNDTHKDVIIQALEAGKAVYTDKPIAHTLEDASRIEASVAAAGAVFAVGHSSRRLSGHREMKRWLEDGRLGDVSLAEANFSNERGLELTPQTWRYYADKSPGGAFIQLGVHHADTLQFLLGPVKTVTAHARRLYTSSEVPDAVMAILEFERGPLGYIGTGWASPGVYSMNLLGTKANLMYDLDFTHWDESQLADDWSTLRAQFYGESVRKAVELQRTDMFREQLDEFALAIRGEASVEVGAAEAVRALAVVRSAMESSQRDGQAVQVDEVMAAAGADRSLA
jgi:predicted dehydrogenase